MTTCRIPLATTRRLGGLIACTILLGGCGAGDAPATTDSTTTGSPRPAATVVDSAGAPATGAPLDSAQTEAIVAEIRRRFQDTERASDLVSRTVDIGELSPEGGEAIVRERVGAVVKISAVQAFETGRTTTDFYLDAGRLYFVFDRRESYVAPLDGDGPANNEKTEDRYYFDGDRLVRWVDTKGVKRDVASRDATDRATAQRDLLREIAAVAGVTLAP